MAVPTLTPLPPAEAIAALTRRGLRLDPTFGWQEAFEADHAAMFTVAKSAGFDILKDIHEALVTSLSEGTTFEQFARQLRPTLAAKGWWGRKEVTDPETGEIRERTLGSTQRLRTIFDTNMRVSYAAGHWGQFERNVKARPVLRYVAILDGRVRPAHRARHNLTLPVNDPYWDTWAPPCGWGCRCTLQSLSLRDVERMRGELKFTPPPETIRRFTNRRTGEVVKVPDGIDPGWGYNPGKAGWLATSTAEKLISAPPVMAAAARADRDWPAEKVADEFAQWFDRAREGLPVDRSQRTVGAVDRPTLEALDRAGIALATGAIAVEAETVAALAGAPSLMLVPAAIAALERLPETIAAPRAVLLDPATSELLYVLDVPQIETGRLVLRVEVRQAPAAGSPPVLATRPNRVRSARLVDLAALIGSTLFTLLSGAL